MKGLYICDLCGKSLASSQSLWNHKQRCPKHNNASTQQSSIAFLMPEEADDSDAASESSDSMMQINNKQQERIHPPSEVVLKDVFAPMIASMPRTTEDIIGWCSDDEADSRIEDIAPIAKELYNRFKILHCQFMKKGHYEHRNDLMFLLGEMLRRGFINQKDYAKGVDALDDVVVDIATEIQSLDDSGNQGEEMIGKEDEHRQIFNSTSNYIIQHDKKELMKLIQELKQEFNTTENLLELEKVIEEFLIDEERDGKLILPIINDLLRELEKTSIPRSKHLRLQMLIDGIDRNRYRVKSIFNQLDDAEDNEQKYILKRFLREELLSEDQFKKLSKLKDLSDLTAVGEIVKDIKIGQGLTFLPRTFPGLYKKQAIRK